MQLSFYVSRLYNWLNKNEIVVKSLLILYWIVLFTLTSLPSKSLPNIGVSDKIEHFGAFFVLTVLFGLHLHFKSKSKFTTLKLLSRILIILSVYSLFDELHQKLIPGRFFDWFDLLANLTGIIFGLLIVLYFINIGQKKNQLKTEQ